MAKTAQAPPKKVSTAKKLKLVDLDHVLKTSTVPTTILNDLPSETEEEREAINNVIMTTYDNQDILSSIPSCQCGELRMGYNIGKLCTSCHTQVERPVESTIGVNVWMRVPDGVDGFILPAVWMNLSKPLTASGFNLMEWICNSQARAPANVTGQNAKRIAYMESIEWPRGINSFIRNIDRFIDQVIPNLKLTREVEIQAFLRYAKPNMFPKHLPMPTKALLVLEKTVVGSFADLSITGAIDAARTVIDISREGQDLSPQYMERKTVSIMKNLTDYYTDTIKKSFSRKRGWLRGQLFSSRSHFCFRGVITSKHEPEHCRDYKELHIPWAQGLEVLKIHLINKLLARGYNIKNAYALVEGSGKVYVPLLDELMQELIRDFDGQGIPCIFQRNPTLARNSAQTLYISKIKPDVEDNTISLSVLVVKGPNADFDGDEMNGTVLLDKKIGKRAQLLEPHFGIHSLTNPGELNHIVGLPDVTSSNLANFLNDD